MVILFSMIKNFLIAVFLLFTCVTCTKDSYQNFPNVPVNITLNIATDLASLGIGTTMVSPVPGGVKGIIIYRSGLYEFVAYERLCTNYPNDTCAVIIDSSMIIAVSPCDGSKFLLIDGSILKGPARFPLKQYSVAVYGNRLYIGN